MSTDLTRDEACDKYLDTIMRSERSMARHGFNAGWSARDAEVERLRAALVPVDAAAAYKVRFWEDDWNPLYHVEVALTVAECRAIRAALAHKEPSDA